MRPLPCQVWVESQHECHEHGSGILPEVVLAREETAVWAEMDLGLVKCGHCQPPEARASSCAMLLGDEAQHALCCSATSAIQPPRQLLYIQQVWPLTHAFHLFFRLPQKALLSKVVEADLWNNPNKRQQEKRGL